MNDLSQHLIARVLLDTYTSRPGKPAPRYNLTQAQQALAFIARQMNQDHTRDLAWWQIPRWAPTRPRILASMVAGGLLGMILGGLVFVLRAGLGHALGDKYTLETGLGGLLLEWLAFGLGVGLPLGLGFGRGGREPKQVGNRRAISWPSVLTAGLTYGLAFILTSLLTAMLASWLVRNFNAIPHWLVVPVARFVGGFTLGLPLGLKHDLLSWHGDGQGSPQELVKSRRKDRVFGLVAGLVFGLGYIWSTQKFYFVELVGGIMGGIMVWLGFWLMPRLAGGFVAGPAVGFADGEGRPQGPLESWRNDRVLGLQVGLGFGLGAGLVGGLVFGMLSWFRSGGFVNFPLEVFVNFPLEGLTVGLVYGITSSVTWSTTLAWLQLQRSRRVPTVGLMSFLEDARDQGVLRTVGAVYQFRHTTLQDRLAGPTIPSPRLPR